MQIKKIKNNQVSLNVNKSRQKLMKNVIFEHFKITSDFGIVKT